MNLASELQAIKPVTRDSPVPGFEYVRGFGVYASPFDSGHVLALRVFPENVFAPYKAIWHRTPDGQWSIFVDGPRLDTACPRYYGAAARHVQFADITLTWTGPMELRIEMDLPRLVWNMSMATTPLVRMTNSLSSRLPERVWRIPLVLRVFERMGDALFDLGNVTLSGIVPNGHFAILMPQQMFPIMSAKAELNGEDLGHPARIPDNPAMGDVRFPARPTFAVGQAYFEIQDPVEYQRTIQELREVGAVLLEREWTSSLGLSNMRAEDDAASIASSGDSSVWSSNTQLRRYGMTVEQTRQTHEMHAHCGPGYASPSEAMNAEREKVLYVIALYGGTGVEAPDYLATVDVDPTSPTYSQVIHRTPMPNVGDELHHFGWNACSSCHGEAHKSRRFLIIPGFFSSRIHIVDTADKRAPRLYKVIEPEEVKQKTNLSGPHSVHCLADGHVMISMLGDGDGNGPGGFLLLDEDFNVAGCWARETDGMRYNYDFWYQPRHNVMVSSELGAPNTYRPGFDLDDVAAGKYGRRLHFWDWQARTIIQSVDLGEEGLIPLEVRFHHNPESTHGYVGAALSSNLWHWHKANDQWEIRKVVDIPPIEVEGWPFPVPSLMTDLLISMDDRYLYLSNWLHGDIRQYDISDPVNPRITGQVWCGGVLGKASQFQGRKLQGGPQMLQLSLDGKRLYVTNSLLSSWDNQFYPELGQAGSYLLQIDCDTEDGGLAINPTFYVDFGQEPAGPARAHEMRYPGGDCTSDIWG